MNISPWDIYWILQLDSVIGAAKAILICCGIVTLILLISSPFWVEVISDLRKFATSAARRVAYFAVPALLVTVFVPSSKTAAAMVVLPAIANNANVQQEAGEPYAMAKDALREAIKPDDEKK
jgi:isopentenyl diphosphate isomerase/L-lactate dehydrogenase-like FMN-dependent dehydrogenase